MRDRVRFLLGDEARELDVVDPTMTVLDYLRLVEGRTGTKEGCAEGDCGACTVVVVRPDGERLRYEAVNACIRFLGTLDGCQVLTVEDLKETDGSLHPVQQAMADCHGSQCGFCTPGFVMSLFALYRSSARIPDDDEVDDVLAGNLCRCTGYAPIVRAAQAMHAIDGGTDSFAARETKTLSALAALQDDETVAVGDGSRRFFAPATTDVLAGILSDHPQATIVAGATDVGLWVTKDLRPLDPVVWLGRVRELQVLEDSDDSIEIGAGVTYSDAVAALSGCYPDMGEVVRRLGSVQVRNAGTIGGNIANGSPIGDSPPLLIATGATLHLRRGSKRRSLPLEDFFIDYGKQDRAADEFVERISVPKPAAGARFRAYKISKRFDQDISAVLGAFLLRIADGQVLEARLAFGGMAAVPKRAHRAEAALVGQAWSEASVAKAQAALTHDFTPITDMRASAAYRLKVAQNLLMKLYVETAEPRAETRLVGERSLAHA